jgi:hypothetical protein
MLYKTIITGIAFLISLPALGAPKNIARVDGNGDVIFDREMGHSSDIREVEISELDGSIYVSFTTSTCLKKFSEDGIQDTGFDLPLFYRTLGFDIDDEGYLWIAGLENDDEGLYKYTSSGDYIDGLEDFYPQNAKYDGTGYIWCGARLPGSEMNGVHKINVALSREFYLSEYRPLDTTYDKITDEFWFTNVVGTSGHLVKLDEEGNEELYIVGLSAPMDLQASPLDGGCWFFTIAGDDLVKVNSLGAVIYRDSSFSDIAAIDVNESDGSVWVASNIPKRLVHLDKDGNRQLYKPWPGGDFAHLAVDQQNGTCIVIYEEYRSGDMNIQPASVGEIKAIYAE